MQSERSALDLWIKRNLKTQYGAALKEAVPDELIALLPPQD